MKVEEIKLAFEVNVQFALIDDIKKGWGTAEEDYKKVAKGINDSKTYIKEGMKKSKIALDLTEKGITMAKEIGLDVTELQRWKNILSDNLKFWANVDNKLSQSL